MAKPSSLLKAYKQIWHSSSRRLLLLKWALCAALLSGLMMSPKLWVTDRPFPTIPVFSGVPDLPQPISVLLSFLLFSSVLVVAALPNPRLAWFAPPIIVAVLVLFDINRLQPFVYEYMLMFLALGFTSLKRAEIARTAWAVCGFVIAGIYVWSGSQKINMTFATTFFPWLLQPFGSGFTVRFGGLWYIAPAVEISAGLCLFFSRSRVVGLVLAVGMNAFVLLVLGPLGHNYNSIVWPWNFWLAILVLILFVRNEQPLLAQAWSTSVGKAIITLIGILPALNFIGKWDGFLSGSYYSGKLRDGWIYLNSDGMRHLPIAYTTNKDYFTEDSPGRYRLDITEWTMDEMNVPPYAEARTYIAIARKLKKNGVPPGDMLLMVRDRPALRSSQSTYSPTPF